MNMRDSSQTKLSKTKV